MSVLTNMESLVERLTGNIKAVIDDRENTLAEIAGLRERLAERDKEAVKAARDMRAELDAARMEALRLEQERVRVEMKLQGFNDRLTVLAGYENHCGG